MQCRVYFPGWFHFTVPFFQIEVDSGVVRVHLDLNTCWLGRVNLLSEYIFEIYFFQKYSLRERWTVGVYMVWQCFGYVSRGDGTLLLFCYNIWCTILSMHIWNLFAQLHIFPQSWRTMLGCLAVGWLGGKHYWCFENQKYWAGLEIKAGDFFFFGFGGVPGLMLRSLALLKRKIAT